MLAEIPFLGAKISLISKCDIRYEGILYCVDPKESTIALSKVKSYGTETRGDPTCYVAPKNEVYDIIIFRASDVKDLRVAAPEPPGLTDPAIIRVNHSYSRQSASFNNNSNSTGGHASPSTSGPSTTHLLAQQQQQQQQNRPQQRTKPLLPFNNSASGAPTAANQLNNHGSRSNSGPSSNHLLAQQQHQQTRPQQNRPQQQQQQQPQQQQQQHNRQQQQHNQIRPQQQPKHLVPFLPANKKGGRGPIAAQNGGNSGYRNRRGPNPNNRERDRDRDNNSKGHTGNYRRHGPIQGGRRPRSGDRAGAPRGPRKGIPLKFDGEYDFDEANKLFLELDNKFKGMKLKEEKDGESSGNGANSKSPAGHSESASGFDSDDQDHKDGDSKDEFGGSTQGEFYDKSKSFFDNISCEASERSRGKVNKPDWRKERQTNTETFGVATSYRRGGYRGRSYGYQRR